MVRWKLIGQITHVLVTVLTVAWLWWLTDWVYWVDEYQYILSEAMDQLREKIGKFSI